MDKHTLLSNFEQLLPRKPFSEPPNDIRTWITKVIPLLKLHPNPLLHEDFNEHADYLLHKTGNYTRATNIRKMITQVELAIKEIKLKIQEENNPDEKFFPANSHLELQKHIANLIKTANDKLWICDAYLDHLIIEELNEISAKEIKLLTKNKKKLLFNMRLEAARKQLFDKNIEVRVNFKIHDRWFIIDERDVWSLGTSYDSTAGGKPTMLFQVKNEQVKIIDEFKKLWQTSSSFT